MLSFASTATTSSSSVLATLHLQDTLGLSPLRQGLTLVLLSGLVVGSTAAEPLLDRHAPPTVALGT